MIWPYMSENDGQQAYWINLSQVLLAQPSYLLMQLKQDGLGVLETT